MTGRDGADVQAAFCAVLVDEWARAGVTDAVVAPGSRSTPLVMALDADPRVRVHVVLDERSAGFVALGLGSGDRPAGGGGHDQRYGRSRAASRGGRGVPRRGAAHRGRPPTGRPSCTTSGPRRPSSRTACTARRSAGRCRPVSPSGPRRGAGGHWRPAAWPRPPAVRPAPGRCTSIWPSASRCSAAVSGSPFRRADPAGHRGSPGGGVWRRAAAFSDGVTGRPRRRPGLIVAGAGAGVAGDRWFDAGGGSQPPGVAVFADPRSGCRVPAEPVVAAADALLRVPEVAAWRPDVVLRMGAPWASKVLGQWLAELAPPVSRRCSSTRGGGGRIRTAGRPGGGGGPGRRVGSVAGDGRIVGRGRAGRGAVPDRCLRRLGRAVDCRGAGGPGGAGRPARRGGSRALSEPGVARAVVAGLPRRAACCWPRRRCRSGTWSGTRRRAQRIAVLSNRGANGIDGVLSTAIGVALAVVAPVVALVGDLAFLYDAGALLGAASRDVALTIVVVDNDGGGIFSFLPQAAALPAGQFERYWGTPHGDRSPGCRGGVRGGGDRCRRPGRPGRGRWRGPAEPGVRVAQGTFGPGRQRGGARPPPRGGGGRGQGRLAAGWLTAWRGCRGVGAGGAGPAALAPAGRGRRGRVSGRSWSEYIQEMYSRPKSPAGGWGRRLRRASPGPSAGRPRSGPRAARVPDEPRSGPRPPTAGRRPPATAEPGRPGAPAA